MNKSVNISKPLMWLMVLLLAAIVAGCGSGNSTATVSGDTTVPSVSLTAPLNAATGVSLNANVTAIFSEAMDATTLTTVTFTLTPSVSGAVTYLGNTATFNPTSDLAASTSYTATVSTSAKDLAGNALATTKTWIFTTGTTVDSTPPSVISIVPASAATGIAVSANIVAVFSETMLASTITAAPTFTLSQAGTPVAGVVTFPGTTTATFNPNVNLTAGLVYTATITTGAQDLAGNVMLTDKIWSFTAAASAGSVVCGGASGSNCVDLLTAGNFVILDQATVTFTPIATVSTTPTITGNIGLSPAAASFITGFALVADATNVFSTSTQVIGQIFASDYAPPTPSNMTTAISDKNAAYIAAGAKPTSGGGLPTGGPTECPGVGAMSDVNNALPAGGGFPASGLPAGVYTCSVNITIPGTLTLNGTSTDVWVFKTTGTLAQATATNVILTGGALPQNVFWQVAGGVLIQGTAHMEGVILSASNIQLITGATVTGRLLAATGVLMDSNAVTQP